MTGNRPPKRRISRSFLRREWRLMVEADTRYLGGPRVRRGRALSRGRATARPSRTQSGLLPFLRQAGAAQRIGERTAALFLGPHGGRVARWATRRGTAAVISRRGCAGAVGMRADFVVQPECQRDALTRHIDFQDLDPDNV